MHLVHDDRIHTPQHLARRRGEHEVKRLGRRDEDIRWVAHDLAAFLGSGVAGAHSGAHLEGGCPSGSRPHAGQLGNSRKRPLQVAIHIGTERLQGRHVQHAHAPEPLLPGLGRTRLLGHEVIDGPQKRRQRLTRARRRDHKRVIATGDGVPSPRLHRRGHPESPREPFPHRLRKR